MAKKSDDKKSLVIKWPRHLYYSDYLPIDFFADEVIEEIKSHPILIDKKSGDFLLADCKLTVIGKMATLDYRGMNHSKPVIEDGVMTVIFKGKSRKSVVSVEYKADKRNAKKVRPDFIWSDEDESVLEGERIAKEIVYFSRKSKFMEEKKAEQEYCCEACGYQLKANGRFIIDCHHMNPVSMGKGKTEKKDLLVLCPNCHRIAHTNNPPLKRDQIRKVLKKAGVQVVINK